LDNLRQFLFDHVTTYDELEVLLLAQRKPAVYWSAATAAETVGLSTEACRVALERLAARGLLVGHSSRAAFRYAPNSQTLATGAKQLQLEYGKDRFAIVQMMTANSMVRVRGAARNLSEALQQREHRKAR
jgi:hypothetical protein